MDRALELLRRFDLGQIEHSGARSSGTSRAWPTLLRVSGCRRA